MDFIDRLLGPRGAARGSSAPCTCSAAPLMFLLAWLVWLKADRIWAYRDATDVLRIVYGPFVYFMAVMIGLTGVIHLYKAASSRGRAAADDRGAGRPRRDDGASPSCACPSPTPWASSASSATPTCATGTGRWPSPSPRPRSTRPGRNYTLSVVPLFILMGNFVTRAGMSQELFRAAYAFIGHLRGGLAMATVWASAGFGGICGSSIATTATMAKVAYPSMKRFGYADQLAAGTVAGGGHARHHDPAVDDHGDLRRLHRDQYRQALRGRDPARHPRRRAPLPGHRVHDLARIRRWGPPRPALVAGRERAHARSRTCGRWPRSSCS